MIVNAAMSKFVLENFNYSTLPWNVGLPSTAGFVHRYPQEIMPIYCEVFSVEDPSGED